MAKDKKDKGAGLLTVPRASNKKVPPGLYGRLDDLEKCFDWFIQYANDHDSEFGVAYDFYSIPDPLDKVTFAGKFIDATLKLPAEARARLVAGMQSERMRMDKEMHDAKLKSLSGGGFGDLVINLPFGTAGPWPDQG
jgi:hypothetical protein